MVVLGETFRGAVLIKKLNSATSVMLYTQRQLCFIRNVSYALYAMSVMLYTQRQLCFIRNVSYALCATSVMLYTRATFLQKENPLASC